MSDVKLCALCHRPIKEKLSSGDRCICNDSFFDTMADAMEKKKVRITFGLQPEHIETIESELKRWTIPVLFRGEMITADMKYSKGFWDSTAKIVGWCPFTLAMHYLEYLEKKRNDELP